MTEVFVDIDGLSGTPAAVNELSRLPNPTVVEMFGYRIEERIFENWAPGVHKLVWCFEPISQLYIRSRSGGQIESKVCHIEYHDGELEQARERVRAKFIEVYRLDQGGP